MNTPHINKWLKSKKRGWGDLSEFFTAALKDLKKGKK